LAGQGKGRGQGEWWTLRTNRRTKCWELGEARLAGDALDREQRCKDDIAAQMRRVREFLRGGE